MQTRALDVPSAPDVESMFATAQAWGADALTVLPIATVEAKFGARITALAAQARLPVMYGNPLVVTEDGGLMCFAPDYSAAWRQSADYVDKILRGASPAEVPVAEPLRWDFYVNVMTAKELAVAFPPDVAVQVTQWVQ
jgi:putative ABC transport system substrate-binding protein